MSTLGCPGIKFFARLLWLVALVFIYTCLNVPTAVAGNLTLNGSWRYSDSRNEEDSFNHDYTVAYGGQSYLTDNISFYGNIRYFKRFQEDFDSDYISPSFSLVNLNDIYRFNLGGNYSFNKDSNGNEGESWSWSSNISSSWVNPLFPFLQAYYRQSGSLDDGDTVRRSNVAGGLVRWSYWDWLGLQYHVDWNENKAISAGDSDSEQLTQRANLSSQKVFYNRLNLGFSVDYLQDDYNYSLPTEDGGFALLPLVISQASYEETDDPLTGPLTNDASFLLTDEEPPVTLDIDPANDPMNLGMRVDFQQVDAVHLGTLDDISDYADNFSWDVYSSADGIDWVLEAANIPFVYNTEEQRFEFELDSLVERYVKLIADTASLLPIQVTRVESIQAFRKIFGGDGESSIADERQRKNLQTQFNLGYLIMQNLRFSYNFSYQKNEDTQALEYKSLNNSGSLSWTPSQYFSARLNASESRDELEDAPESMSRRYALSLASSPLTTLDFSFGFNRNEDYLESDLLNAIHNYTFYTTAQLYDDLTAVLDLSYSDTVEGDRAETFSERLTLTARLSPTLLLNMDQRYTQNLDTKFNSFDNQFSLNWRLSDIMYMNNSLGIIWDDASDTLTTYGLNVGIAPNSKNRITLRYGLAHQSGDIDQAFTGNWNWLLNRLFSFQFSGVYAIPAEADNNWQFSARLNYQYTN